MKKFLSVFLSLALALALLITPGVANSEAQAAQNIKVYLDGQQMSFSVQPRVEYGTTLVPMRAIFEALGANVQYNGNQKKITATKGSTQIVLYLNNKTAYVNNSSKTLERPAKAINGVTLVPLRFVSESLNADVGWNGSTQTVTINTKQGKSNIQLNTPNVTVAINGTAHICLTLNPEMIGKKLSIMQGYDKNIIDLKWVDDELTPEGQAYIEVCGLQAGKTTVSVCFEGDTSVSTATINVVPTAEINKFYQGTDVPTYQYVTDISPNYCIKRSTNQSYSEYVPGCDSYFYFNRDENQLKKYLNALEETGYRQTDLQGDGQDLVAVYSKKDKITNTTKSVGIMVDTINNTVIIDVSMAR